jgi:hypothetical protein
MRSREPDQFIVTCPHSDTSTSSSAKIYSSKNYLNNNLAADRAGKPQDYKPKVCAIYAKSKSKWLNQTPKVYMPSHFT